MRQITYEWYLIHFIFVFFVKSFIYFLVLIEHVGLMMIATKNPQNNIETLTLTLDRLDRLAFDGGWGPPEQRLYPQYREGRSRDGIYSRCGRLCSCTALQSLRLACLGVIVPSSQHCSRSPCRWPRMEFSLPTLTISGGIPSLPRAFPHASDSIAFLSSSVLVGESNSSIMGSGMVFWWLCRWQGLPWNTTLRSDKSISPFVGHGLLGISPEFNSSGAVLMTLAFFIPSYMALVLPFHRWLDVSHNFSQ